jgi:ribonucleoside-diphosphate reductase alpha chain
VFDVVQLQSGGRVVTERTRDDKLTAFGKATLSDRYLLPGESYQ